MTTLFGTSLAIQLTPLIWPMAVALAWVVGEFAHRWTGLPRISFYGLVGVVIGGTPLGSLAGDSAELVTLVANVGFGLILFEFGYRINLRWLHTNPWLGLTSVLVAVLTFAAAYNLSRVFGMSILTALLLASLAMSTSPAAVLRVINEQRSTGQVTERVLHLTAVNCVLAVFAFKVIVGVWTFENSGELWPAVSNSVIVLLVSAALGVCFGVAIPALLRHIGRFNRDATLGFAIGVIVLVSLTHVTLLSPVLAALTFGLVARHRRVVLNQTQRNFGALGELLAVLLFVFVASTISWQRAWVGLGLGLGLIGLRLLIQTSVIAALARRSGMSVRKGALTGLAMTPMSVFVILLLEQTRHLGVDLVDQLAPLAAATLILELVGPVFTQRALAMAGEVSERPGH